MSGPYYTDDHVTLWHGDAAATLATLPDASVDCVVTSPPYFGLRDYGVAGQLGAEASPAEFVAALTAVFREARRVLADDGTLWLNLGDSYASDSKWGGSTGGKHVSALHGDTSVGRGKRNTGLPDKNLIGVPWRTGFALQDDGWILRNEIIWAKPNAMPESVTDRLSSRHEHLFMFSKSHRYWFDLDPIREPLERPEALAEGIVFGGKKASELRTGSSARRTGNRYGARRPGGGDEQGADRNAAHPKGRNPGDVWMIATRPFPGAHFAVFPPEIPERAILAGCKPGGVVLDPFSGSGTTGMAAAKHGRRYVGIELNEEYLALSLRTRLAQGVLDFGEAS